jgi:hypothetical protein
MNWGLAGRHCEAHDATDIGVVAVRWRGLLGWPVGALANTALLTTLMSHGMLLLIALVYLLSGTALAVVVEDDPVAQPQGAV